jgi:hypothetical protein
VVDHGFESWSCQTKDYNTGITASLLHCVLMVIFSTNINKINNYLSPQIIEHKKTKMQTDLAWDRHKSVEVLNEFKSFRHLCIINVVFICTFEGLHLIVIDL